MRIALFSEVYWPMVSGVGVTLLRLTEALQARGHEVRVYTASYPIPDAGEDRPEVHRSPSMPFFLYPDVQWAFPRLREVVDDPVAAALAVAEQVAASPRDTLVRTKAKAVRAATTPVTRTLDL